MKKASTCLLVKTEVDKQSPAFVTLYADDSGVIGTQKVIISVLNALTKVFQKK